MDFFASISNYMGNMTVPEGVASILVVIGVYRIAIPKFDGQLVMAVAQSFWIIHAAMQHSPGLLLQSIILLLLNFKALVSWRKKSIGM